MMGHGHGYTRGGVSLCLDSFLIEDSYCYTYYVMAILRLEADCPGLS